MNILKALFAIIAVIAILVLQKPIRTGLVETGDE